MLKSIHDRQTVMFDPDYSHHYLQQ